MTNPVLASEEQLQELFEVSPETTRRWRRQGLVAVGSYTPPGGRPLPLYNVSAASRFRRS